MDLLPQAIANLVELISFRQPSRPVPPLRADPEDYTWTVDQSISRPMPSSASRSNDSRTDTGRS